MGTSEGGQSDSMTRLWILDFGFSIKRSEHKKISCLALFGVLFALSLPAHAQQPAKVPRIGVLGSVPFDQVSDRIAAFRQGLRELGYVESKNIFIEWRSSDANLDRNAALAAELLRLKVDVIVSMGSSLTRAAKAATSTVPIVMTQEPDPVGNGFVASLARPGGNMTGLSTLAPELSGKRLEILKEVVPSLSRVAVFLSSVNRESEQVLKEMDLAASALKLKLQYLDVVGPKDFETAFKQAFKARADAVVMEVPGPVLTPNRKTVLDLAVKHRLPLMYRSTREVDAGGLMTYGVNLNDLNRRAATYVDKILKGANPGDLPVEQPKKFEFIINLKTAKQIGLTIPPNVLARADRVIR
jgi:putative ABC transport system substrate-binding protein